MPTFLKYKTSIPCFLLLVIIVACSLPQRPEIVNVEALSIDKVTSDYVILKSELNLYNPNKIKFIIKSYDLDLYMEDKLLSHVIYNDSNLVLYPNSNLIHTIKIKATISDLLLGSLSQVLNSSGSNSMVNIGIKGKVKIKLLGIGKKIPIDLTEQFSLGAVKGLF